jgi:hypothetical protein
MTDSILNLVPETIGAWLALPAQVRAPSPEDKFNLCNLRLGTADVLTMARSGRRQLTFEVWSCVLGLPPPIPGCGARNRNMAGQLTGLEGAHALFQGLQRPLAEDDEGANVLAYILKPKFAYCYDAHMVSAALKIAVPQDVVFVVYVRLDDACDGPDSDRGTVTHWGFVEADQTSPELPIEFSSRYRTRLW